MPVMKKAQVPLAILLGAVIGAGGYFAASRFATKGPPPKGSPSKAEMAEVRKNHSLTLRMEQILSTIGLEQSTHGMVRV